MTDPAGTDSDLGFAHRFEPGAARGPGAPTLLLLHGTGGNEDDLLPLGRMLAPGANLLSPRGQVLESGMPRFFRRLAEGVFDLDDLRRRTADLAGFVEAATGRYGLDPSTVTAAGFSNGANIAGSLLLLRPGVLRAGVLLAAMVPLRPDPLPDLAGTPVFLGAGRADPIAPPAGTDELATLLTRAGADVTVHWHDAGHTVTPGEVDAARRWLAALVA